MSRYSPVRPRKKHRHQHPAPQSAAEPPMPTEAQMEAVARDRLQRAYEEIYKLHNGQSVDAAIRRTERLLQIHDREAEKVLAAEPKEGYRWTVSPAMYLRLQAHLEAQQQRQLDLQSECWAIARETLARIAAEQAARAESLCPPKQTSAPTADVGATLASPATHPNANPAEGGQAAAPPIAA